MIPIQPITEQAKPCSESLQHCSKCKQWLPESAYSPSQWGKKYTRCKTCRARYERSKYARNPEKYKARARRWEKSNPEKSKQQERTWYERNRERALENANKWQKENPERRFRHKLKDRFGLTSDQYYQLLKEQNFRCAGCLRKPSELKIRLAVDHCHDTGKIRGLLCTRCNYLLGRLEDTFEGSKRLSTYLSKPSSVTPTKKPQNRSSTNHRKSTQLGDAKANNSPVQETENTDQP
jgi:Recombination endonuclease VII